jgi:hypothetical protein
MSLAQMPMGVRAILRASLHGFRRRMRSWSRPSQMRSSSSLSCGWSATQAPLRAPTLVPIIIAGWNPVSRAAWT